MVRTFLTINLSHVVATTGSRLTTFSLGVWAYQSTGSTTLYGAVALAALAPTILASPFMGVLVDRRSPRAAMLVGHAGALACTLALLALSAFDLLTPFTALPLVALAAASNAPHLPALSAAATRLAPPKHLGRANGALQLGTALSQMIAPALAGTLLSALGLRALLLVSLAAVAIAIALLVSTPAPEPRRAPGARKPAVLAEAAEAWRYIRERPGLNTLLALVTATNFNLGLLQVSLAPLVMGFADAKALGVVTSVGGSGMLVGSLAQTAWGGPARRVRGILGFFALEGLLFLLGGARPSIPLIAAGAFGVMFFLPLIVGGSMTLWQSKVPPFLQGRVFAIRTTVSQTSIPVGYILAGPLADHVFEPLMAPNGALAGPLGPALGVGAGRGVALLFVALGLLTLACAALGLLLPRLRRLEAELPDVGLAPEAMSAPAAADAPASREAGAPSTAGPARARGRSLTP